jgi:pimeloyl-ACP methyl ester carboxylesterase
MSVAFLTLADRRIAYQRQVGDSARPGVIFLGGFASDMTGTKAIFLSEQCARQGLSFVRFDYRGCGQSPGIFTDGTIGAWLEDSLAVFDQLTVGPQIVVGSSMGGWLGLLLAKARPERVKAFIGVAAAPDFTEDLVWEKLTRLQRETLLRDGLIYEEDAPPDHRVPLTLRLIEEARGHLLLRSALSLSCPVRLIQGMKDAEVPFAHAQRIAEHVTQDDVQVTLIKNSDHRLSQPENLGLLWRLVAEFISD